jgi:hypothetical protein
MTLDQIIEASVWDCLRLDSEQAEQMVLNRLMAWLNLK